MIPPKDEVYISTDIESDGPIPGPYSMLSFASAAFHNGKLVDTFTANLELLPGAEAHPDTKKFWEENAAAYAATRVSPQDPATALSTYVAWVKSLGGKPVFVAYPAGFDFLFMYWYMISFAGESPFSFSALDTKTLAMAALGCPYRRATLDDAMRGPPPGTDPFQWAGATFERMMRGVFPERVQRAPGGERVVFAGPKGAPCEIPGCDGRCESPVPSRVGRAAEGELFADPRPLGFLPFVCLPSGGIDREAGVVTSDVLLGDGFVPGSLAATVQRRSVRLAADFRVRGAVRHFEQVFATPASRCDLDARPGAPLTVKVCARDGERIATLVQPVDFGAAVAVEGDAPEPAASKGASEPAAEPVAPDNAAPITAESLEAAIAASRCADPPDLVTDFQVLDAHRASLYSAATRLVTHLDVPSPPSATLLGGLRAAAREFAEVARYQSPERVKRAASELFDVLEAVPPNDTGAETERLVNALIDAVAAWARAHNKVAGDAAVEARS